MLSVAPYIGETAPADSFNRARPVPLPPGPMLPAGSVLVRPGDGLSAPRVSAAVRLAAAGAMTVRELPEHSDARSLLIVADDDESFALLLDAVGKRAIVIVIDDVD